MDNLRMIIKGIKVLLQAKEIFQNYFYLTD